MALILVGQSKLWENKLKLQRYSAIRQGVDMNCTLPNMDLSEMENYVRNHLDYADCTQERFTSKVMDEEYRISKGIPAW